MTASLRHFFQKQRNCTVTNFFTDNGSIVRDIIAGRPQLVIIQFALISFDEQKILESIFPNTIIATWTDSKPDQEKFDSLKQMTAASRSTEFIIDEKVLLLENSLTHGFRKYGLTRRELDVLQLLSHGKSYQQVCDELNISYETVRSHVQHVCFKIKVKGMTAAVAKAIREKLVK